MFSREDNRVWFFTNERLAGFLNLLPKEIKKICAIGGSGDFAFNILTFLNPDEIILCDKKPTAEAAVEFKKELFEKFNFSEIKNLFFALVKILKKSKLFYNESFRYLKFIDEYLVYLQSEEKYEAMRSQLDKIKFITGDFSEKLKTFPDNHFDLIYVSNILDSGDYNADNVDCLRTIKRKLTSGGMLLAVIQDKVEKQIEFIEQYGFALMKKEAHTFNFITSLKGHYYFSFALFRKQE